MCAWAALFALLLFAFWWKQEALIDNRELFASLEEDRRLARSRATIIRTGIVLAALYLSIGIGVWKAGGFTVLAIATTVTLFFSLWLSQKTRDRLRKHEEFWDWWQGSDP